MWWRGKRPDRSSRRPRNWVLRSWMKLGLKSWLKSTRPKLKNTINCSIFLTVLTLSSVVTAFAVTPTTKPASDKVFDAAGAALDKAKKETQELRDKWDKARLEVTLYEQRSKRAYQKWVK